MTSQTVEVCHLYISGGHNFFGHHGRAPDDYPAIEVSEIERVAGRGGHFAAWEQPDLFTQELRTAFKSLR